MACNLTLGRKIACKDALGGIDKLYFLNFQEFDFAETANVITGMLEDDGLTAPTAYEYLVRDSVSNLAQNVQSSRDNGTTWVEQIITAQLQVMSQADNEELMLLAYGRPVIIVKDRQGKYWLAGKIRGCDVSAIAATTGAAMGDLNGYTLTINGMENKFAQEVASAVIDTFTVVVGA